MRLSYQAWNTTGKRRACTRTAHSGLQRSHNISSVAPSLGATELIFIEPQVKNNGGYYRDVLLAQNLLPALAELSGEFFIFQQDSAPAHRAYWNACSHSTVRLATKQPWSQSCRLQDLGSAARSSVPDENTWCGTSEVAPDRGVAAVWSEHHRRSKLVVVTSSRHCSSACCG